MIKQHRYKIALVGEMLSGGGAERVQAGLSVFFESKNIEVHHIIVRDVVTYEYAGVLFNMGKLKDKSNTVFNKWKRFQALKKYLKEQQFDFIIDFRVKNKTLQEFYIAHFVYKIPYVVSIRSYITSYYFPKNLWLAKNIYKKAYGIITVTRALEEKIRDDYGYSKVHTIHNPIDVLKIQNQADTGSAPDFQYMLGVGRFHEVKQFDHLIHAYANSVAPSRGIKLVLMGNGDWKESLVDLAEKKGLKDKVVLVDFQKNPFPYYKKALLTVMTSRNEGFPNVLTESLACGTPVISYDCPSGPSEIIIDRTNGLLVENQNLNAMTAALDEMLTDENLYDFCASNAVKSLERFNFETIGNAWLDFLNIPTTP